MSSIEIVLNSLLPREANGYRARLLQLTGIFAIILLNIFLQIGVNLTETTTGTILGYAANIAVTEVVNLTNKKRVEHGLPALNFSSDLAAAAKAKGEHMLQNDYWAHVAPDGTEPWKFFCDHNYCDYRYAGENLARDFSNPNSAVEAWMASPSHRENMLSNKYTEIGIAVVEGDLAGSDTTLVVQLFGSKLSGTPEVPAALANADTPPNAVEPVPTATVYPAAPTALPVAVVSPNPSPIATATPSPTVEPTPSNQPIAALNKPTDTQPDTVLAAPTETNSKVLISPFNIKRTISFSAVGIFLLTFAVDAVVISKSRVKRKTGRTLAHFSYLTVVLIVVLLLNSGKII